MCKKITAFMLSFVMVLTLILSAVSFSAVTAQTVSTEAELIAALNNDANIVLENNITVSSSWTPKNYSGDFNGNGYIISGLNAPLFDTLSYTYEGLVEETRYIQNLGLVAGDNFSGRALLANTVSSNIIVQACFAYGDITYTGNNTVGGLVATLSGGRVTESFSCVNITSSSSSYCGGLIGEISSGIVTACYSSGTIDCTVGKVAGLGNLVGTSAGVSDTYTTCQIKHEYIHASPSGVNGVYDNQLGIVRESVENSGVKTRDLMENNITESTPAALSASFAITSTAYPSLVAFYDSQYAVWTPKVRHIVRVSTAAASVFDADSGKRKEPSTDAFYARMDYLTPNVYIDKTNVMSLSWNIDSEKCKIYDVVPDTNAGSTIINNVEVVSAQSTSTSPDLLRSRFVFNENVEDAQLTATSGSFERKWYLSSYSQNPYFNGGDGKTAASAFQITNTDQLDKVRYYSLIDPAEYTVTADIENIAEFDPINSFIGTFNGQNYTLSDMTLNNNGEKHIGLFGSTQDGAVIKNVRLRNVIHRNADNAAIVGTLIGKANGATISNVMVSGDKNSLDVKGTCGGLVGEATNTDIEKVLVSIIIKGDKKCGGIVGEMNGGRLTLSGSTGYIAANKNLGGLVGVAAKLGNTNAYVSNCYSTMSVFSGATGTAGNIAGLVGEASTATVQNGYFAGLVHAPSITTGVGPFVGAGTAGSNLYYDRTVMTISTQANGKTTDQMLGTSLTSLSNTHWYKAAAFYPQLAWCKNSALSQLSTTPVYFQNYWNDNTTNDMTTGWIAKTNGNASIDSFTAIDGINNGAIVYDVNNGYGFEATDGVNNDVKRVAYIAVDSDVGIRVVAAVRNSLQMVTFSVEGKNNVPVMLEIYYAVDNDDDTPDWRGSQMKVTSSSTPQTTSLMYAVPLNCKFMVKVSTADDYAVQSVTIKNMQNAIVSVMNDDENNDGTYCSADAYSNDIHIVVTLTDGEPLWGLRDQTY